MVLASARYGWVESRVDRLVRGQPLAEELPLLGMCKGDFEKGFTTVHERGRGLVEACQHDP